MIKKYIIIGGLLSSLTLLGGTASANEQLINSFESRLSVLNNEILRIEGGMRAQGMGCETRLTILIDEFPTLFLQNYVCDADTKGRAQIMLRQS
ncbi:MAG: hypothetical protein COB54_01430 [Alphaproteobacteria bacterium]|nr:MAG: hypothetical protein COB54_01430 [Alphaproteobacteria bacterium]